MGIKKVQIASDPYKRREYFYYLLEDLRSLEYMLDNNLIESNQQRIGIEQEISLVSNKWRPSPIGPELVKLINDPFIITEFARFNLELSLPPKSFTGTCLSSTELQLKVYLDKIAKAAEDFQARYLLIGILPTVQQIDVLPENLTPEPRYQGLFDRLHELRGGMFELHIEGIDQLILKEVYTLIEACNTSFQVHLQVPPEKFVSLYNWAMVIAAPLLSTCSNSPLLFNRRLWHETRVALYRQSFDTRTYSEQLRNRCQRISLGNNWLKNSVLDLFKESIMRFKPVLYPNRFEDSYKSLMEGKIPKLVTLDAHNSTSYWWNRVCYGITNGKPHLRIENRLIPSGPTLIDEIANAAFWLGMMNALPSEYLDLPAKMNFDLIKGNFIKAAREGLGAHLYWMGMKKRLPSEEIILKELLPLSREGLEKAKIDNVDIDKYLSIIEERIKTGKTGSKWLIQSFSKLKKENTAAEAAIGTTAVLFHRQQLNLPIHTWENISMSEAGNYYESKSSVDLLMKTDLITVDENDSANFAIHLMRWKNIHHLPVVDTAGNLVGMLTTKNLEALKKDTLSQLQLPFVKDLMEHSLSKVSPGTSVTKAIEIMHSLRSDYLLVVQEEQLIGIVTENDLKEQACSKKAHRAK